MSAVNAMDILVTKDQFYIMFVEAKKERRMNIFTNVKNVNKHSNMDSLSHIIKEHTVVFLLAMKM